MLLHGGEQVQLENNARMPRRHHLVGDELPRLGAAIVAIEADAGAHLRVFQRRHSGGQIAGMGRGHGIVASDPAAPGSSTTGTMTGFAADPVARLPAFTALSRSRCGRMAAKAGRRSRGIAQPQGRGNLLSAFARQRGKGPAVRAHPR